MMYSMAFRAQMVKKMTGPNGLSANALSKEVGVSQTTLSKWLRQAANVPGMSGQDRKREPKPASKPAQESKRAQDWTPTEKLQLVIEAASIPEHELGSFLRRKGVYKEQFQRWKEQATAGFDERPVKKRRRSPEQKRIRELERQIRRKDKALAETTALLVLKKNWRRFTGTRTGTICAVG